MQMMARDISIQPQATEVVPVETFRLNARHVLNLDVESAARLVSLRPFFGIGIWPVTIVDRSSQ